jgi:hypothetical protein
MAGWESEDWATYSYDPMTGIKVELKFERIDDDHTKIHYRRTQDDTALFKMNAERRAENAGKKWGDGAVAASVPLLFYYDKLRDAAKEGDQKYINRVLNDSDYSKFRTKEGRL